MRNPKGFIITLIIIAAPIVWLVYSLGAIEEKYPSDDIETVQANIEKVVNEQIDNANLNESSGEKPSGESQGSPYGNPISKVVENAKINVASTSVYQEPDDASSLVGSIYKDMVVTVQDYPNGWSNIKYGEGSGWVRSEYVTKPEDVTSNTSLVSAVGKKGSVICNGLNVRTSGASDASVIETIENGTEFNVIGANEDESWLQIQYGTKSGWVSGSNSLVKINY